MLIKIINLKVQNQPISNCAKFLFKLKHTRLQTEYYTYICFLLKIGSKYNLSEINNYIPSWL